MLDSGPVELDTALPMALYHCDTCMYEVVYLRSQEQSRGDEPGQLVTRFPVTSTSIRPISG